LLSLLTVDAISFEGPISVQHRYSQ
jgi:hypothetical protein